MKTLPALAFLILPCALLAESAPAPAPVPGAASGVPPRPHGQPGGHAGAGVTLGRLLEMDGAKLARMRGLIEKVEQMPAAERAALSVRMRAMRDAPPAERQAFERELREKFGPPDGGRDGKSPERQVKSGEPKAKGQPGAPVRDLLEKHFASLPPAQAKAEKEKFLKFSREEKMAYLKSLRGKHGLPAVAEPDPAPAGDAGMQEGSRPAARPPGAKPAGKPVDRDDPFRPVA